MLEIVTVVTVALVTVVIVTYFSKNYLTPQRPIAYSRCSFFRSLQFFFVFPVIFVEQIYNPFLVNFVKALQPEVQASVDASQTFSRLLAGRAKMAVARRLQVYCCWQKWPLDGAVDFQSKNWYYNSLICVTFFVLIRSPSDAYKHA